MDKKLISSGTLICFFIFFALVIISLLRLFITVHFRVSSLTVPNNGQAREKNEISIESQSAQAGVSTELPLILQSSPGIVQGFPALKAESPAAAENPFLSQAHPVDNQAQQEGGYAGIVGPINAPLTDKQIMEDIQRENEVKEKIRRIRAERDAQAAKVLRIAQAEERQSAGSPAELMQYSQDIPPADIVAKVKSGQLAAH